MKILRQLIRIGIAMLANLAIKGMEAENENDWLDYNVIILWAWDHYWQFMDDERYLKLCFELKKR